MPPSGWLVLVFAACSSRCGGVGLLAVSPAGGAGCCVEPSPPTLLEERSFSSWSCCCSWNAASHRCFSLVPILRWRGAAGWGAGGGRRPGRAGRREQRARLA